MRLDSRVWLVMIAAVVLLEGFYMYRIMNPKDCSPFPFTIKKSAAHSDTLFKKDDIIFFTALINNENIIWDFGDNSPKRQGRIVTHVYTSNGKFDVKTSLAGCDLDIKQLTISTSEPAKLKVYNIQGADSAQENKRVSFYCADSAGSYEWSVKDYPDITAKGSGDGQLHEFTFPIANNTYTIQCRLDKDKNKIATHYIFIKPKPVVTIEGPKISIADVCNQDIDEPTFAGLLTKVTYNEFSPDGFSQYLCKGIANTKVVVNGKQKFSFQLFCQQLAGLKKEDKFDKRRGDARKIRMSVVIERADEKIRTENVKGVIQSINVHLEEALSNNKGKHVKWVDYNLIYPFGSQ